MAAARVGQRKRHFEMSTDYTQKCQPPSCALDYQIFRWAQYYYLFTQCQPATMAIADARIFAPMISQCTPRRLLAQCRAIFLRLMPRALCRLDFQRAKRPFWPGTRDGRFLAGLLPLSENAALYSRYALPRWGLPSDTLTRCFHLREAARQNVVGHANYYRLLERHAPYRKSATAIYAGQLPEKRATGIFGAK